MHESWKRCVVGKCCSVSRVRCWKENVFRLNVSTYLCRHVCLKEARAVLQRKQKKRKEAHMLYLHIMSKLLSINVSLTCLMFTYNFLFVVYSS